MPGDAASRSPDLPARSADADPPRPAGAAVLAARIAMAREALELRQTELQRDLAHHETWRLHVESMAAEMSGEDRLTQDRIVEAVSGRQASLRSKLERVDRDQALLNRHAGAALADPDTPAGDLVRILDACAPAADAADAAGRGPRRAEGGDPSPSVAAAGDPVLDRLLQRRWRRSRLPSLESMVKIAGLAFLGYVLYGATVPISGGSAPDPRFLSVHMPGGLPQVGSGGVSLPGGAGVALDIAPLVELERSLVAAIRQVLPGA